MKPAIAAAFLIAMFLGTVANMQAGNGSGVQPEWYSEFDAAREAAAEYGRPILIDFSGSDWCIPCMRLERDLFSTDVFREFAEEYLILLKVDFPSKKKNRLSDDRITHNEALAQEYNPRGTFPLVVLTDSAGMPYGVMTHPLASAEDYLESIRRLLPDIQ